MRKVIQQLEEENKLLKMIIEGLSSKNQIYEIRINDLENQLARSDENSIENKNENEKLKKAIEILKGELDITVYPSKLSITGYYVDTTYGFGTINKEDFELLDEVLGDE